MIDGVRWAVDEKLASPGRVCIYGASYGGYAALQAPRLAPGMFRCAIGYAGVYDLPLDQKDVGNVATKRFFARTMGSDGAELTRISPARHAADIKLPVFLVHGKDDQNARFEQYKVMLEALTSAGNPPETYTVAGEGHGFYSPESQAEMYRRMERFLAAHLAPR